MAVAVVPGVRDVLAAYPGLADVAVLELEQEPAGRVLVAYVVPGRPWPQPGRVAARRHR